MQQAAVCHRHHDDSQGTHGLLCPPLGQPHRFPDCQSTQGTDDTRVQNVYISLRQGVFNDHYQFEQLGMIFFNQHVLREEMPTYM